MVDEPEATGVSDADGVRIARQIVIPRRLQATSAHEIWRAGGPGLLLARLATEDLFGPATTNPLTGAEIAQLVELFADEALPVSLKTLLFKELKGERRRKPGPKPACSTKELIELAMLPSLYRDAVEEAKAERQSLAEVRRLASRRSKISKLPTVSQLASERVRKWLPTLRHLSDKALANKLSELKAADEKCRPGRSR